MANVIENFAEAVAALKNSGLSSGRTDAQIAPWEAETGVTLVALREFHAAWLMYMDGGAHNAVRARVISILSKTGSVTEPWLVDEWAPLVSSGELNSASLRSAIDEWHRRYLGLSAHQHRQLFQWSAPILDFFFQDRIDLVGGCEALERWVQDCQDWFLHERFDDEGLMGRLRLGDVPIGTCINVAMDSYEPLLHAIGSAIFFTAARPSEVADLSPGAVAAEVLRLAPPFRFINRIDVDPLGKHRKTTIDLFAVHRDAQTFPRPGLMLDNRAVHLSFGYGRHACPGARHALEVLETICSEMKVLAAARRCRLVSGELSTEAGYCRVTGLCVRIGSGLT